MSSTKYTTPEQIAEMRRELLHEKHKLHKLQGQDLSWKSRLPSGKSMIQLSSWIVFSALVLLLVTSIISINLAKNRGEIPNIWGFQLFSVESGSMEPTLPIGSLIVSRIPKEPGSLTIGDIVTFRTISGIIVTHRIIEVIFNYDGTVAYRTKGDNPKNSPDPELLTEDRVIGLLVAKIPLT
ncbi:MAG: S26 family signal peptidase [Gracilibacter sp. BRH_c7a]|nr:MAG: S26 family signal peptidase [Gracilibacter sp. BRH_c7a]